uniref:C-type lectin domain-containing protein n=1 Tax=Plectus sambesii TaxID=2011161 RepID=A0A914WEA0_9BILA
MAAFPIIFALIFCWNCHFTLGDTDWDTCPSGCSYQVQQRTVTVTNDDNTTDSQRQFQLCKSTNECPPIDEDGKNCSGLHGFMTNNRCYKLANAPGTTFTGSFSTCQSNFARMVPALLFELRASFLKLMPYILEEAQAIASFPYAIWTGGYALNAMIKWKSTISADYTMINNDWDTWVQAPPANSSTKYCLAIVVQSSITVNMQWLDCSSPNITIKQVLCMLQGRRAVFDIIPGTISISNSTQSLTTYGLSSRWFCGFYCKREANCQTAIYCPTYTSEHNARCYTTNVKYTDPTTSLGFNISTSGSTECYILDRVW